MGNTVPYGLNCSASPTHSRSLSMPFAPQCRNMNRQRRMEDATQWFPFLLERNTIPSCLPTTGARCLTNKYTSPPPHIISTTSPCAKDNSFDTWADILIRPPLWKVISAFRVLPNMLCMGLLELIVNLSFLLELVDGYGELDTLCSRAFLVRIVLDVVEQCL